MAQDDDAVPGEDDGVIEEFLDAELAAEGGAEGEAGSETEGVVERSATPSQERTVPDTEPVADRAAVAGEESPDVEPKAPEGQVQEPSSPPLTAEPAALPAQPPQPTPEELNAQYTEWRSQVEQNLATQHYALSEEAQTALDEGDNSIIPQLMARVCMDAITGTLGYVSALLPGIIDNTMQQKTIQSAAEDQFYKTWPQLKDQQYSEVVMRAGQAYRQLYPQASTDDFIRDVGAQAMVALRLQPGGEVAAQPAHEVVPFQPSRAGAAPGAATAPPTNPFTALFESMERDEAG